MRTLSRALLVGSASLVGLRAGAQQTTAQDSLSRVATPIVQAMVGGGFAKTSSTPLNPNTHGFNLQAGLAIRTPLAPLRLRVDGLYSEGGRTRVEAFTAGAMLSAPARWTIAPFLLAGGGGYAENGAGLTSGWNLGAGVNLRTGRLALFMESRVHAYRDALAGQPWLVPNGVVAAQHESYRYLWHPLTVGFRF